jgi:hypothetical protein
MKGYKWFVFIAIALLIVGLACDGSGGGGSTFQTQYFHEINIIKTPNGDVPLCTTYTANNVADVIAYGFIYDSGACAGG